MQNFQTFSINTTPKISAQNPEIFQVSLESILGGEAGVHKKAFFVIPFFEATVVEQLQVILNDEGHNIVLLLNVLSVNAFTSDSIS
jgi:hypothetical protein